MRCSDLLPGESSDFFFPQWCKLFRLKPPSLEDCSSSWAGVWPLACDPRYAELLTSSIFSTQHEGLGELCLDCSLLSESPHWSAGVKPLVSLLWGLRVWGTLKMVGQKVDTISWSVLFLLLQKTLFSTSSCAVNDSSIKQHRKAN